MITDPYKLIEKHFKEDKSIFKNFKIFEAGFGDLGYIMDFYYKIPFSKYLGIEIFEKHELRISNLKKDGTRGSSSNGKDDEYERYVNYFNESEQKIKLTREQFMEIFFIEYETMIESHIVENDRSIEKYDLGIFSNIFHKFSDKTIPINILKWFRENSTENSFLYFKVMKTKSPYENIDFIYTKKDIEELVVSFKGEIITQDESDENFNSYLLSKKHT